MNGAAKLDRGKVYSLDFISLAFGQPNALNYYSSFFSSTAGLLESLNGKSDELHPETLV